MKVGSGDLCYTIDAMVVVGMLLVSRSGLGEEVAVEFHFSSSFLMKNFPSRENNNVVVFSFPFHILTPLAQLMALPLSRVVSHPKGKTFP